MNDTQQISPSVFTARMPSGNDLTHSEICKISHAMFFRAYSTKSSSYSQPFYELCKVLLSVSPLFSAFEFDDVQVRSLFALCAKRTTKLGVFWRGYEKEEALYFLLGQKLG